MVLLLRENGVRLTAFYFCFSKIETISLLCNFRFDLSTFVNICIQMFLVVVEVDVCNGIPIWQFIALIYIYTYLYIYMNIRIFKYMYVVIIDFRSV
jgi:hypothetical protein